ncbi:hypothetical protein TSAR_013304 [Trichomalopsis sarcophagae]|uniref:Uncharacterized protein n=1 Tax=Trichomalopsis sarcophagae TaxID=543379 RepID=A0A232EDC9_9HYME|nr:hypothetical protein TSAR_013304 [Trichomalopsis sarcophagae]
MEHLPNIAFLLAFVEHGSVALVNKLDAPAGNDSLTPHFVTTRVGNKGYSVSVTGELEFCTVETGAFGICLTD